MNIDKLIIPILKRLSAELQNRHNQSYVFFDTILKELNSIDKRDEAIDKLRNCYSITQYANFNHKEELLLDEILKIVIDNADPIPDGVTR